MFLPSRGWQEYFGSPDRGNESLPHRPYLILQHSPILFEISCNKTIDNM